MKKPPSISRTLLEWCGQIYGIKHPRVHSRQYCYEFFQGVGQSGLAAQRDQAALTLGFYLASWGMYRGSGFLLDHSHTIHYDAVDVLADSIATPLWDTGDPPLPGSPRAGQILAVAKAIVKAYQPLGEATDTLVTKILLGTTACIPATDRFFRDGFKKVGLPFRKVDAAFINLVLGFWSDHESELRGVQTKIQQRHGILCPPMVLVDTYFHRLGYPDEKV